MEREEHLFEELCAKGKAYRKRRMAAGEKHGAYLSGRAVKVCKGQMSGKKKKKANEDAMKKSAKGMAMYGKSMNEEAGEINVFSYQTQHFNACPGAQSLYKAIVDGEHGKQDEDLVIRVAKLHDSLFYIEKVAKEGGIDVTSELIDTAQNMADLIISGAEKMKLEKEHNYIQGHVDTIKDLAKDKTVDEVEVKDNTEFVLNIKHLLKKHVTKGGEIEEIDALHENEEYCPKCAAKIKEIIKEEVKKVAKEAKTKPAKGKRFAKKVKNPKTGRTRTVSYGQAGKAKKGGDRIRPGTAKGNAYCARSAKIKKCKNPPCANTLSRKKWKCQGSRSVK